MMRLHSAVFVGLIAASLTTATLVGSAANASTVLTENFNEVPFGLWQSGWFGTESNAQNAYVYLYGDSIDYRGNNPDGLWIADGGGDVGNEITIYFNPDFALYLTAFSLDVATYVYANLRIFDKNGGTLLNRVVPDNGDALSDPGEYTCYSVNSSRGIGGFSFTGLPEGPHGINQILGNVSIANLSVTVSSTAPEPVPEPSTWAMLTLGFAGLGFAGYRTSGRVISIATGSFKHLRRGCRRLRAA
jgi:hypothetical protein